ncbi:MAG: hypothetical protein U5K28_04830 [Halobacteriales archaeon]|nr:hypothetical protein [Halobacteriales archaeon]
MNDIQQRERGIPSEYEQYDEQKPQDIQPDGCSVEGVTHIRLFEGYLIYRYRADTTVRDELSVIPWMRYRTSSYLFNNKHDGMGPGCGEQSSWVTALGLLVALVAIVGTQFLDWEWGSGQPVPTIIGIAVAGIAVLLVVNRIR